MPTLHVEDIKDLKLSDFPQFSCLCELCDCGCFERGKNKHAETCKKKKNKGKISNAITPMMDAKDFHPHTLYADTYIKFDLGAGKNLPTLNNKNSPNSSPSPRRATKLADSVSLIGRRSAKMSTKTTTNENFKMWNSNPAPIVYPLPDHASDIIYPTTERNYVTTNDRMMFKNYGNFKARPPPLNHFENNFKINQGKMTFDSSYHHDYNWHDYHKPKVITRTESERRSEHIPMFTETQTMSDYKYDPKEFRSVWVPKKVRGARNLFLSHLDPHLHPHELYDDPVRETSYALQFTDKSVDNMQSPAPSISTQSYQKPYDFTSTNDKSVHYVKSFDNTEVPILRVLETLPNKFTKIPPIKRSNSPSVSRASTDFDDAKSTYQTDFQKKAGLDICMSKAYRIMSNKKAQNSSNNPLSQSLISIKE